jgi:hypothetical protein
VSFWGLTDVPSLAVIIVFVSFGLGWVAGFIEGFTLKLFLRGIRWLVRRWKAWRAR